MRPTQRRTGVATLLCALLLTTCLADQYGCGAFRDPKDVDWPQTAVDCGPVVDDVVSTISTILLGAEKPGQEGTQIAIGPSAKAELEQLAANPKYGAGVVSCLVDLLSREWTRQGASANPQRFAAAQRAKSFLEAEGVHVRSNEAFKP